jgi:hypothetical protein
MESPHSAATDPATNPLNEIVEIYINTMSKIPPEVKARLKVLHG